jgi:hypothetical protein
MSAAAATTVVFASECYCCSSLVNLRT